MECGVDGGRVKRGAGNAEWWSGEWRIESQKWRVEWGLEWGVWRMESAASGVESADVENEEWTLECGQ